LANNSLERKSEQASRESKKSLEVNNSKINAVKEAEEILDKRFGKGYTDKLRSKFKKALESGKVE